MYDKHRCMTQVQKYNKQEKVYNGPKNILFHDNLMIVTKSTKSSLIRTYFLIKPLISRCDNLRMLSTYRSYHILHMCTM